MWIYVSVLKSLIYKGYLCTEYFDGDYTLNTTPFLYKRGGRTTGPRGLEAVDDGGVDAQVLVYCSDGGRHHDLTALNEERGEQAYMIVHHIYAITELS